MAHDVFLSHSSLDKTAADAVCATLEARGIRCWVAPRDIAPGSDWGSSIIEGIESSTVMVLVFSHNANSSVQIKREIERAVAKGLVIVPFRIEEVVPSKALEYFLSTPHWLDAYTPPLEQHLGYLADSVAHILKGGGTELKPPKLVARTVPWWRRPVVALAALSIVALAVFLLLRSSKPADQLKGTWHLSALQLPQGSSNAPVGIRFPALFDAAVRAGHTSGAFTFAEDGQAKISITAESAGRVTSSNGRLLFTSVEGTQEPENYSAGQNLDKTAINRDVIGVKPDQPLALIAGTVWFAGAGKRAANNVIDPAVIGTWMDTAGDVPGFWSQTVEIAATGRYRLVFTRTSSGLFTAESGRWQIVSSSGDQGGAYTLDGGSLRLVEASGSFEGTTTTWKRGGGR